MQHTFTPVMWMDNFRVSRETFLYICEQLRPKIAKMDTTFREALPVEERVAVTLWFLATPGEYRTIAHLFGIADHVKLTAPRTTRTTQKITQRSAFTSRVGCGTGGQGARCKIIPERWYVQNNSRKTDFLEKLAYRSRLPIF